MYKVTLSKLASKQLEKTPVPVVNKVLRWANQVETAGIRQVRLAKSLHDEPLQGKCQGQISVRLNKQWRLIYSELTFEIIEIQEITPHDYRTK